jgi:hypothetical protein
VLRATGTFGPAGTVADVRRWMDAAGLTIETLESTGAITHFEARRGA